MMFHIEKEETLHCDTQSFLTKASKKIYPSMRPCLNSIVSSEADCVDRLPLNSMCAVDKAVSRSTDVERNCVCLSLPDEPRSVVVEEKGVAMWKQKFQLLIAFYEFSML